MADQTKPLPEQGADEAAARPVTPEPASPPGLLGPLAGMVARLKAGVHTKLVAGFLVGAVLLIAMGALSLVVISRMDARVEELARQQERVDRARQMEYAITVQSAPAAPPTAVTGTVELPGTQAMTQAMTQAVDLGSPQQVPAPSEQLYEGTVLLDVRVDGSMALVIQFTQQLREGPEFRLLRLANSPEGGVDIWLGLREPVPLGRMLSEMEGVAGSNPEPTPTGTDPRLVVALKGEAQVAHAD